MGSFREHLAFSIGFAISQSKGLLRRILKEHTPDEARRMLAERVIDHLERSNYEIDEEAQTLRQKPPTKHHSSPAGPPSS